jgi:outer membrane biosynthesis protein TonB
MFTWICPKCGREVPPSYTDCPDCAVKTPEPRQEAVPVASRPMAPPQYQPPPAPQYQPPPPPPQYQQAPPQYQQAPPQYAPPYQQQQQYPPPPPPQAAAPPSFYAPPPERSGLSAMPTWLMSILFAVLFAGVVFGVYTLVQGSHKDASASAQDSSGALGTTAATQAGASNNPLLKQVEVAGLRLTQNKAKKTEIRFLLVNHSGGDIQDLAGTLSLRAKTSKSDEEPIGVCAFKLASLGPYESKDMAAVLNTKLKVYELPDWQKLDAQLQITSP